MPIAWVLNLDADEELQDPNYRSTAARRECIRKLVPRLEGLLHAGDRFVAEEPDGSCCGLVGRAWCPTPAALARLERAGALLPEAPAVALLRRVNHREFCATLGQTLPGAAFVHTLTALRKHVASEPRVHEWLVKRPFGFSGRGSRRTRFPTRDVSVQRWLERSFEFDSGMQLEPWVDRELDFAIHGFVARGGELQLGKPTLQVCTTNGVWRSSRPATGELVPAEREALLESASVVATALHEAGYWGPFGVDAYRWRETSGVVRFNPRSEINARYTMGWHVGMGDCRPDRTGP